VYPEFVWRDEFIDEALGARVRSIASEDGFANTLAEQRTDRR